MKTYYFMSGLPRAGSTLLSVLLNQNPRFYSGPASAVKMIMESIHHNVLQDDIYNAYPKPEQTNKIIGSVIDNWYNDIEKPVIIDKNRGWAESIHFIEGYMHIQAKVIVPVRSIDEILTSFLTMIHRNPFREGQPKINIIDEELVKSNIPISDENRCQYLLSSKGVLNKSLESIKKGIQNGYRDKFYFIDYNDLMNNPQQEMNNIYNFLGEELFQHTFSGLSNEYREDDLNVYGLSDMHHVHSDFKKTSKDPSSILPESIMKLCRDNIMSLEFWK